MRFESAWRLRMPTVAQWQSTLRTGRSAVAARLIWDQEDVSSSLTAPTEGRNPRHG